MKRLTICTAVLALAITAPAKKFTDAPAGQGVATVGSTVGADFATLAAAATDFNSVVGGLTGVTTLTITSDLTEPNSVNFANETNGFPITIKPSTTAVVTFTSTTRWATTGTVWDASILLGPRGFSDNTNFANMDDFTIDGSATVGGSTRDLTIKTTDPGTTQIQRNMIRVVGGCDNVTIKNVIITNVPTGTTDNTCIDFNSRKSSAAVNLVPNNGKVINCQLNVNNGGIGQGVVCRAAGAVDAGNAMTGMTVSDCDINASLRAVHYNNNAGGVITRNRIKMSQYTAAVGSNNRLEVIAHGSSNAAVGPWTLDISRNNISQMHTVAIGGYNYAIGVGGGSPSSGSTYNVVNNMVTGYETTQTVTNNTTWLNRAIALTTANSAAIYNIYHNSINMVDLAAFETAPAGGADTAKRLSALSLINAAGFAGTLNFVNNIVRYTQRQGAVITNTATQVIGGTQNYDGNAYFIGSGGTTFAFLNDVAYPTLASWQAASRDLNSTSVDPFAPPSGGKWISQSNLHLDAAPAAALQGLALPAVPVDLDGQARPASAPAKGADEFFATASVTDWALF